MVTTNIEVEIHDASKEMFLKIAFGEVKIPNYGMADLCMSGSTFILSLKGRSVRASSIPLIEELARTLTYDLEREVLIATKVEG